VVKNILESLAFGFLCTFGMAAIIFIVGSVLMLSALYGGFFAVMGLVLLVVALWLSWEYYYDYYA
jgi:hypothetical protein